MQRRQLAGLQEAAHIADRAEALLRCAGLALELREHDIGRVEGTVELVEADEFRRIALAVIELIADQFLAAAIGVIEEALRRPDHPAAIVGGDEKIGERRQGCSLQRVPAERAIAERGDQLLVAGAGERPHRRRYGMRGGDLAPVLIEERMLKSVPTTTVSPSAAALRASSSGGSATACPLNTGALVLKPLMRVTSGGRRRAEALRRLAAGELHQFARAQIEAIDGIAGSAQG